MNIQPVNALATSALANAKNTKQFKLRFSKSNITVFDTLFNANLLTKNQYLILQVLNKFFSKDKCMFPSQAYIANALGIHSRTVSTNITKLAKKGLITKQSRAFYNPATDSTVKTSNGYFFADYEIGCLYRQALHIINKRNKLKTIRAARILRAQEKELNAFITVELEELASIKLSTKPVNKYEKPSEIEPNITQKDHVPVPEKDHPILSKDNLIKITVKPKTGLTDFLNTLSQDRIDEARHLSSIKQKTAYQAVIKSNEIKRGIRFSDEELKRRAKIAALNAPQHQQARQLNDEARKLCISLFSAMTANKPELFSSEQLTNLLHLKSIGISLSLIDQITLEKFLTTQSNH